MIELSLTEARAQLPTLLHRVEEGEIVHISRHGRPVAVLVGHDEWVRTKRIDILERARATGDWLDELRADPPALPPRPDGPRRMSATAERRVAELRAERDGLPPVRDVP